MMLTAVKKINEHEIEIICRNTKGQIIDPATVVISKDHPIYKVMERINHEKNS